ncbi:MAG: DUF1707 domain-containing protein [Thermoleophilia bacterium]
MTDPGPPGGEDPPASAILASDAERDGALERLRDAVGEGRLTLEELAERTDRALAARTRGELEAVTAGLPAPASAPVAAGRSRGTRWVLGIMGGGSHRGRWRIAERCSVVNVMGGADLDLRQATIDAPEITITVVSLMGGSDILVPEGVDVEMSGFALMGGDSLRVEGPPPGPGAPRVHIRSWSIMGGTDVRTAGRG